MSSVSVHIHPIGAAPSINSGAGTRVYRLARFCYLQDFLSEQWEALETNTTLVETYKNTHGARVSLFCLTIHLEFSTAFADFIQRMGGPLIVPCGSVAFLVRRSQIGGRCCALSRSRGKRRAELRFLSNVKKVLESRVAVWPVGWIWELLRERPHMRR